MNNNIFFFTVLALIFLMYYSKSNEHFIVRNRRKQQRKPPEIIDGEQKARICSNTNQCRQIRRLEDNVDCNLKCTDSGILTRPKFLSYDSFKGIGYIENILQDS
jgi:hypothetical protein